MFTELDKFNNLQIYQSQSKKNHWGFISPENEYITTRSVKKGQIFNHFGNAIALQLELLEHLEKHKCDKIRIWIPDFEKEGFWAEMPVREIEKNMPAGIVYAAYSACKIKFKDVPADYSEVYVYGDPETVKKRFPPSKNRPNLFILSGPGKMTIANIFVDLWNMKEWYAKDFLAAMEAKIHT